VVAIDIKPIRSAFDPWRTNVVVEKVGANLIVAKEEQKFTCPTGLNNSTVRCGTLFGESQLRFTSTYRVDGTLDKSVGHASLASGCNTICNGTGANNINSWQWIDGITIYGSKRM
jgi:hypothetical protein